MALSKHGTSAERPSRYQSMSFILSHLRLLITVKSVSSSRVASAAQTNVFLQGVIFRDENVNLTRFLWRSYSNILNIVPHLTASHAPLILYCVSSQTPLRHSAAATQGLMIWWSVWWWLQYGDDKWGERAMVKYSVAGRNRTHWEETHLATSVMKKWRVDRVSEEKWSEVKWREALRAVKGYIIL